MQTKQNLTDELSDVILGNKGMTLAHTGFDYETIVDCETDSRAGTIWMKLNDDTCWIISIEKSSICE